MWARWGCAMAAAGTPALASSLAYAGLQRDWIRPKSMNHCMMEERRDASISIGCYNLLCPTYGVKWKEREAMNDEGTSNWAQRWPVMAGILQRAHLDIVCLQEVEQAEVEGITRDLGPEYKVYFFKHKVRPPDGVMLAVRSSAFSADPVFAEVDCKGVAFGRTDLQLSVPSVENVKIRVSTAHCRGGRQEQLASLADFADEGAQAAHTITVIAADFNEDFSAQGTHDAPHCPFPTSENLGTYRTLPREAGLAQLSRPAHKQAEGQTSGKGKIDYIWVRATPDLDVDLFLDHASRQAVQDSHRECAETGQWPSDHGIEAFSLRVSSRPSTQKA
mmetsp:Transcript_31644/g.58139  ORF Transcript_31644/g.58139 Transcript_31644/m.58139 type:complete len:332 (-) Transcript_31644:10-1005(-)